MYATGGLIIDHTYNALDQLTQSNDGTTITTYDYDLHGNLEQITQGTDITLFEYNGLGRLDNVTLPDTTTIDYTYDADGRRLTQTVNGTDITNYLWDEFSPYGDVVQVSTATEDMTYTVGQGLVLAQSSGSDDYYFYHDGQGSTRALADDTGTIVDSYTYTAFGELYSYTGTPQTDFLYTGQQLDDLTGLYNLRARQYDPALGRFLGRDTYPINYQNPVELNRYVYAANNPINLTDPSGNNIGELSFQLSTVVGLAAIAIAYAYSYPLVMPYIQDMVSSRPGSGGTTPAIPPVGVPKVPDVDLPDIDIPDMLDEPELTLDELLEWLVDQGVNVDTDTGSEKDPFKIEDPPGPPLPVCNPITDKNCSEDNGYDIALGRTNDKWFEKVGNALYQRSRPILFLFAMNLNLDPSRKNYVFPWQDWETLGWVDDSVHQVDQWKVAANFADHIHFNLETIADPIAYANEKGNNGSTSGWKEGFHEVTAAELYIIMTNKSEYCDRITFYDNGSTHPTENHSVWTQICGGVPGE